ncbi:uncharacterized protein LOC62_02G001908 [Vanrija pseudolonga]|uniref:Uncharacterized protein n=1 Tax=Vanrija pseudolonga TaxID=143232 RepID=A0AAF0Y631_9TREE|nr:hypothetical protein LOC62_02G001908 [Vanrija pseudolonga]
MSSPAAAQGQLPTIPEFTPKQELVLRELLAQALAERDAALSALSAARAEVLELKARIKAEGCGCIGESGHAARHDALKAYPDASVRLGRRVGDLGTSVTAPGPPCLTVQFKPAAKRPKVERVSVKAGPKAAPRPKRALSPTTRGNSPSPTPHPEPDDEQPLPPPPRRLNFSTSPSTSRRPTSEIPSFIAFSPLRAASPPRPPPRVLVTPPTPSPGHEEDGGYDPCLPSRGFTPIAIEVDAAESRVDNDGPHPSPSALTPSALAAERRAHAATRSELDSAHSQLEEQDAELARVHAELADYRARNAALEAQRAAMEARALDDEARKRASGAEEAAVRDERESLYAAFNDLREAVDAPPEPGHGQSCVVQ